MNNHHQQAEKIILRNMEEEYIPIEPKNRHQRRVLAKRRDA